MFFSKLGKILLLLIAMIYSANAQQFPNIYFNNLPQNYQLYPRNDKNEAFVNINGYVSDSLIKKVSVIVLKNGNKVKYISQNFKPDL